MGLDIEKKVSSEYLFGALQYAEALYSQNVQIKKDIITFREKKMVSANAVEVLLRKTEEAIKEAEEATISIENELDRRHKKILGLRYGAKTMSDNLNKLRKIIEDYDRESFDMKNEKPKLKLE